MIRWLNGSPTEDILTVNLLTVGKKPVKALTPDRWSKYLRAEHSTLRFLSLIIIDQVPYPVACQLVRHSKEHTQAVMQSGRPDWTGKPRDYSQPRMIAIKTTPAGLIALVRDRLCTRAEVATRDWAKGLVLEIANHSDWMIRGFAEYLKPNCQAIGYCKEGRSCVII